MNKIPGRILIAALALLAVLGTAASAPSEDRPAAVENGRWIKISDTAGIAVDRELGHDRISGRFFAKRDHRWVEVVIENSPAVVR